MQQAGSLPNAAPEEVGPGPERARAERVVAIDAGGGGELRYASKVRVEQSPTSAGHSQLSLGCLRRGQ